MWNQGNGNGQEDVYRRLNNTRDVGGARFPFIEDGTHKLALVTLEEFQHSSDGPCARGLFKIVESKKHQPGSFVVKIWKLVKPPKFSGQNSDADLFADFCRKLKGAPQGYQIGNDIRVLMKERANEQLARGTLIECVGVPNKKGTWTNIYWNTVQQSPQEIAARRMQLEQDGIPNTGGAQPQQYQAQPQYQVQQPQQSVPQGGFLANVPVQSNGNGNNGGNGAW